MSRRAAFRIASRRVVLLSVIAFGVLLMLPGPGIPSAAADGQPVVIRVEEDWRLVLNEPRAEVNAPQFHTVMSPYGHLRDKYAQVLWNYRETPEFAPGGLQLQGYHGESTVQEYGVGESPLSRDAETITWTQRLETDGRRVSFRILNGRSVSWGDFGGDAMSLVLKTDVPSLSEYSPQVSKENSCVTFGANRVDSLVITQVRWYGPDGLLRTDSAPIVVYRLEEEDQ